MDNIIGFMKNMNWQDWIMASEAMVAGLITLFLLIPAEQPEKALRVVANLLSQVSKK